MAGDAGRRNVQVVESEGLGVFRSTVGAHLLGGRDLPHPVIEPVAQDHDRAPVKTASDVSDSVATAVAHDGGGRRHTGELVWRYSGDRAMSRDRPGGGSLGELTW